MTSESRQQASEPAEAEDGACAAPHRAGRRADLIAALAGDVANGRAILFVGAGVSAQLGLPSWQQLIERLGEDLGFHADAFFSFSNDFRSLAEYYRLEKGSIRPLIEWMRREWTVSDESLRGSRAHRLIAELRFPLVYTTNYDCLLERAFALHAHKFNKTINARDMARADPSLPTIVKFHGDIEDGASLVVTETDYFRRLSFEEPLDVKLKADMFGRSVLFLGYSLSDINLRLMLYRMRGMWLDSGYERLQPRSYIFMPRPNPVQERISDSWGIAPIVGRSADESEALLAFLENLCAAVAKIGRARSA
ncbi:MAG TPA: SIR2 family protein [Gammaproteobacteria bacterium]|nr:SIR2 family protein [Gammaproteobacteria bacterium]